MLITIIVVVDATKVDIFKQITTQVEPYLNQQLLLLMPQR